MTEQNTSDAEPPCRPRKPKPPIVIPASTGKLIGKRTVCAVLDISPATLGRLPHTDSRFPKGMLVGGQRKWRESAIFEYLKQLEQDA